MLPSASHSNQLGTFAPGNIHRWRARGWMASLLVLLLLSLCMKSDQPTSAADTRLSDFRPPVLAIVKGNVVPKPGQLIESGTVIIRDGMIEAVGGADLEVPRDAEVIEAAGLYVYPGFIDAGATDLLDEEQSPKPEEGRKVDFTRYALAATRPDNRKSLTPEFRAAEGLKREDKVLEATRKLGFTAVHVIPQGRIASGQGTLLATGTAPLRESLMIPATLNEFELFAPRGDGYPATLMGATTHLRQAFLDAAHAARHRRLYDEGAPNVDRPAFDPALNALETVSLHDGRPVFRAETKDDIHRALNFAHEHDIVPAIWGAAEAHRTLERLKVEQTKLILQLDFGDKPKVEPNQPSDELTAEAKDPLRAQQDKLDQWQERVAGLALLHESGIPFAFGSHDLKNRDKLLENIRVAIDEGLSPDAALAALTVDAATILGIDQRLGTISPGKLAHLVVMTGPFENKKSEVRHLVVEDEQFEFNEDSKPASPGDADEPESPQLAGTWQMKIESADGTMPATLTLAVDDDQLTGSFQSDQGDGRLISGRSGKEGIEFVVGIGAGDRQIKLKFAAKLEGDMLSGELKPAFGAATAWTADRVESSEISNPVKLEVADSEAKPPAEAEKPLAGVDALPTEIREDRLRRSIQTGGNVLIRGATVITGTGETLANTSILVRDGKIAALGANLEADEGMAVIDATNRFVMPGIIDTHSHIMITAGINEATQSIVPEVRIKDVVNSDDTSEYRALAGGVTAARLFHGSANVVGGQDAVVKLKYGLPAHEHILYDAPQGVKFALGENVKYRQGRFPNTRLGVEATLNRAFLEAIDYRRQQQEFERKSAAAEDDSQLLPPRRDLRLEALADIVNHEKFIHSHCYRADEILMLLRVTSNLGIRVWSLQHVLEGYKIAPEIVAHGASCSTFSDWWAYKVEAYDATPYNAALLHEAGANVVIKSDNGELMRHLYAEAAKTVRYGGIPDDEAIQTVTLNPARELGLDDRMGSIEVGKDADVAIFSSHPLSAFARCEMTIIDGEVYFSREDAVTAMLPEAEESSASPAALVLPPDDIRRMEIPLAESPSGRYAIVGATLHPLDGPDIPEGTLLIDGGTIAAIGPQVEIPSDAQLIEAHGLHVWPGLIESGTTLGLTEIGRVRETQDFSEGGDFQPDIRAGVALNPDSELIPVARAGGITTILVRPTGGIVAGQASLAKLGGWTAPEMIVELEAGLQVNWPEKSPRSSYRTISDEDREKARKQAEERIDQLRDFLEQTRLYDKLRKQNDEDSQQLIDPRLEALRPYVNKEKPVFIEADSRQQIAEALLFAEKEDLRIIITGGTDAWKLADELKARNTPVIIGPVMRRPLEDYDPYDAPYANPGRLHAAGVPFCIRADNAANSRNAPFEAAMAVAYGLPEEAALRAVTLAAAEILGIDDRVGSLTAGKLANLVISDGSPLQPTTHVKGVFIEGTPYEPTSRQTRFYERYRSRLNKVRAHEQEDEAAVTGEGGE